MRVEIRVMKDYNEASALFDSYHEAEECFDAICYVCSGVCIRTHDPKIGELLHPEDNGQWILEFRILDYDEFCECIPVTGTDVSGLEGYEDGPYRISIHNFDY